MLEEILKLRLKPNYGFIYREMSDKHMNTGINEESQDTKILKIKLHSDESESKSRTSQETIKKDEDSYNIVMPEGSKLNTGSNIIARNYLSLNLTDTT